MEGIPPLPDGHTLTVDGISVLLRIKPASVTRYIRASRTGRYAQHPFPAPAGFHGRTAYWTFDQIDSIMAWSSGRRGQGVGGGKKKTS